VRARFRVLVAIVIALLVHVTARELVDASRLRVRTVAPSHDQVAIEITRALVAERSSQDAPRVVERRQPRVVENTPVVESTPVAESTPIVDNAPIVDAAPVVEVAPMLPRAPAPPQSFLDRVIAGTSGIPPPRMDELFRAPRESEAESAERKIQAFARAAAARGAPPGPDAGTTVELLEKLDDGTYRYETGGFIATIKVDGAVVFIDKDNSAGLGSSGISKRNALDPYGPGIEPLARLDGSTSPFDAEPSSMLGSGSFDPTAAMLRAQGQEPYEHEKLCFLDDTRDLRAELRIAHERAQMAGLRRSLERAWFDDTRSSAERRAALFAIWDECREEEVGLLARELVESFVRQHLPKGSPDAFTGDELAALNATRTSTMEFAPYG
jgi:hypothetical protein